MTDFYSQNRCVCSTRSHGPLLCAFCLSFHFKDWRETYYDYRNGDYGAMRSCVPTCDRLTGMLCLENRGQTASLKHSSM